MVTVDPRPVFERALPDHRWVVHSLLEHLGPAKLRVVREADLTAHVRRWPICDASGASDLQRGDLVLGVGMAPGSRPARALADGAARAKAAAVVFRYPAGAEPHRRRSTTATPVTILGLQPTVSWQELIDTLSSSIPDLSAGRKDSVPETDLHALADAVAVGVGGHVTIEDLESRILAYSTSGEALDAPRQQTILARQVPEEWRYRLQHDGIVRKLLSTEDAIQVNRYVSRGLRPRLAIALRAGNEVLGYVWVAQPIDRSFDPSAKKALREMSGVIARHIIRHRAPGDSEAAKRREFLGRALEGGAPSAAEKLFGSGDWMLVAFAPTRIPDSPTTASELSVRMNAAAEFVAMRYEGVDPNSSCVLKQGRILVLFSYGELSPAEGPLDLALELIGSCERRLGISLIAGISPPTSNLTVLADLARQAERVVQILARDPATRRASTFDSVAPQAFLLELSEVARNNNNLSYSGPVRRLLAHDIEHRTKYGATLRAYLDEFGDMTRTAASLSIHVNTLRYRLDKLTGIGGLDLSNPDERLVAHIQLRQLDQGP